MESDDLKEFKQFLHRHEEISQANSSALLVISSKVAELEQASITHNANYLNLLLLQKHQIDFLETECSRLALWCYHNVWIISPLASNNHGTQSSNQAGGVRLRQLSESDSHGD
jgi:hypothetical protein